MVAQNLKNGITGGSVMIGSNRFAMRIVCDSSAILRSHLRTKSQLIPAPN
jgi:hypothetical protein